MRKYHFWIYSRNFGVFLSKSIKPFFLQHSVLTKFSEDLSPKMRSLIDQLPVLRESAFALIKRQRGDLEQLNSMQESKTISRMTFLPPSNIILLISTSNHLFRVNSLS